MTLTGSRAAIAAEFRANVVRGAKRALALLVGERLQCSCSSCVAKAETFGHALNACNTFAAVGLSGMAFGMAPRARRDEAERAFRAALALIVFLNAQDDKNEGEAVLEHVVAVSKAAASSAAGDKS